LNSLGSIQHINIATGHGLAFKECYAESWRADGINNLHAITETSAIHYFDLLKSIYGPIEDFFYSPSNISGVGSAYDSVQISLKFNNISACIYASYSSPYINEVLVVGVNGVLKISDDYLYIYGPRDTFNKDNNFTTPPLIEKKEIKMECDYMDSLSKSFDFFITHVANKENIDVSLYNEGLATNKFLLEMQNYEI
jgi:hypothetical protein